MKILDVPQSGRIGTMVSFKTRYGQFRRRYVIPRDPSTPLQVLRRGAMGRARARWRTLTEEQRAAWNAIASSKRTGKRLGQSGRLSGYLLCIEINCNLASLGLPMVSDPSEAPDFPMNPVLQLLITNTNGEIALKLKVSGKRAQYVIVWGTTARSAGVTYVDHFKILGVLPEPDRGLCDITDLHVSEYGVPRAGSKVFIQTVQQINGWRDRPQQVSAIIPAA